MPTYRCCLRAYGLILRPDLDALLLALRKAMPATTVRPSPPIDEDFVFFDERAERKMPPELGLELLRAGVYWEWTTRERHLAEIRGSYFDAEAGRTVHFIERDGKAPFLDPHVLGASATPGACDILARMPGAGNHPAMITASNRHEELGYITHPALPPGMAQHCITARARTRGKQPHTRGPA